MRILLLEDDDPLRSVWREGLVANGHDVFDVATTSEAMALLLSEKFDLAVLDLMVGEANSLALTHYIAYAFPKMRVMVVTGSGLFPRGGVTEIAPGVDWLLRKPISVSDFLAMVDHAESVLGERQIGKPAVPAWVENSL